MPQIANKTDWTNLSDLILFVFHFSSIKFTSLINIINAQWIFPNVCDLNLTFGNYWSQIHVTSWKRSNPVTVLIQLKSWLHMFQKNCFLCFASEKLLSGSLLFCLQLVWCLSVALTLFEVEIGLMFHYSNGHLCLKCLLVIYSLIKRQH